MKYTIEGRHGETFTREFATEYEALEYVDKLNRERNEAIDDTPDFPLHDLRQEFANDDRWRHK